MAQATLDEDDLFGEAANELEDDVRDGIATARENLPAADQIWAADADNVLGVLNGLRTALDTEEARAGLRDARKWFTIGERAGAFESDGELAAELNTLEETMATIDGAKDDVAALINKLPELREELD